MTPQENAQLILRDVYQGFLQSIRTELYSAIEENRRESSYEQEVALPAIRADIKRIGRAIEMARLDGSSDEVIDVLIEEVQMYNRFRHVNREKIKDLAFSQSTAKAMLAEVNRELSAIESEVEYESALEGLIEGVLSECDFCTYYNAR